MRAEEAAVLRRENQALRETNERLSGEVAGLRAELAKVRAELATVQERQPKGPPGFVKANRPKPSEDKQPRRKRKPEDNHGRKRARPTRVVRHELERCPTCGYRLEGESIDRSREVIELSEPQPVEVIQHQVIKRWCPQCERYESPKLDLSGQVLGQGRMGCATTNMMVAEPGPWLSAFWARTSPGTW